MLSAPALSQVAPAHSIAAAVESATVPAAHVMVEHAAGVSHGSSEQLVQAACCAQAGPPPLSRFGSALQPSLITGITSYYYRPGVRSDAGGKKSRKKSCKKYEFRVYTAIPAIIEYRMYGFT